MSERVFESDIPQGMWENIPVMKAAIRIEDGRPLVVVELLEQHPAWRL